MRGRTHRLRWAASVRSILANPFTARRSYELAYPLVLARVRIIPRAENALFILPKWDTIRLPSLHKYALRHTGIVNTISQLCSVFLLQNCIGGHQVLPPRLVLEVRPSHHTGSAFYFSSVLALLVNPKQLQKYKGTNEYKTTTEKQDPYVLAASSAKKRKYWSSSSHEHKSEVNNCIKRTHRYRKKEYSFQGSGDGCLSIHKWNYGKTNGRSYALTASRYT